MPATPEQPPDAPIRPLGSPSTPDNSDLWERRRRQNRDAQRRFRSMTLRKPSPNDQKKRREAEISSTSSMPTPTTAGEMFPLPIDAFAPARLPGDGLPPSVPTFYPSYQPALPSSYPEEYFMPSLIVGDDAIGPILEPRPGPTDHTGTLLGHDSSTSTTPSSYRNSRVYSAPPHIMGDVEGYDFAVDNINLDAVLGDHRMYRSFSHRNPERLGRHGSISLSNPHDSPFDAPRLGTTPSSGPASISGNSSPEAQKSRPAPDGGHPDRTCAPRNPSLTSVNPRETVVDESDDSECKPLLHMSVESGHERVVRVLLETGVNVDEQDRDGSSALHIAVQERQESILRLLLENGACVNIKNGAGKTPTHLAILSNFETGLRLLLTYRTDAAAKAKG